MKNIINKSIFKISRFFVRCFTPHYRVCPTNGAVSPAVYVVHHQNLRGPIVSMAWFNISVHPWVLNVFCDRSTCFRQYYDYTFTKRFGMPKLLAAVIIFPLSFFISGLMQGMQAIPVFRSSKAIIKTFKQSISILIHGQSLLISPDIDYTDTNLNMGEMYNGFLDLERYYMQQTGKHLNFVPLLISKRKHCIYVGDAVCFNTTDDFKQEKVKVYERLKQEFSRLEKQVDKYHFIQP